MQGNGCRGRANTLTEDSPRPAPLSLADVPGGPAPASPLCALSDIAEGASRVFTFRDAEGRRLEIFVHRPDGKGAGADAVAYINQCPHAGHPLDWTPGRFTDPSGQLFQCASHGARFRIEDGFCVAGPCPGRYLTPVAIKIEDGLILAV